MSVSREPIDVLGHRVRPLTVSQIERLEAIVFRAEAPSTSPVRQAMEVVKVALSRDHAAIDVEEIECDLAGLTGAMTDILRLGGFVPEAPGKSVAGPATE